MKASKKPKLRITLLNAKLGVVSDRLVDQEIELTKGPNEKHAGPIRLEVTLLYKDDLDLFIKYMGRLQKDLPLIPRKVYKREKENELELEPVKELWHDCKTKCKTQAELITYLRERNFVMVTPQFIEDKKLLNEVFGDKYNACLIRRIKQGKTPAADKYDPQLVILFKLKDKSSKKVKIYLYGQFLEYHEIEKGDKLKVNKTELTEFPHYMTLEEREKWRNEERKLILTPDKKPSKLFLRWETDILKMNPHKVKIKAQ